MRTQVIDLPKISSKNKEGDHNGYVISFWKDWETILSHPPRQVYFNCCFPGKIKGPHLHMKRKGQFVCIQGELRFVIKYGPGDYEEIDCCPDENGEGFRIVIVPGGIACAVQNIGKKNAYFINMPHPAWHPDNQDDHPVSFDDYKWKWEK